MKQLHCNILSAKFMRHGSYYTTITPTWSQSRCKCSCFWTLYIICTNTGHHLSIHIDLLYRIIAKGYFFFCIQVNRFLRHSFALDICSVKKSQIMMKVILVCNLNKVVQWGWERVRGISRRHGSSVTWIPHLSGKTRERDGRGRTGSRNGTGPVKPGFLKNPRTYW